MNSGIVIILGIIGVIFLFKMMGKGGGCCGGHQDKSSDTEKKDEEKKPGCR